MGDYSYLEAWRAAAARMWPGEHGSRSFGECARCALAAEHGCLSPDQLHVTYWHVSQHVWASEWLIDFRLGACAGRGAVLAPHQRPRAKELRGRVYAAQLTSCAHVLPSSLPPLDLGVLGQPCMSSPASALPSGVRLLIFLARPLPASSGLTLLLSSTRNHALPRSHT